MKNGLLYVSKACIPFFFHKESVLHHINKAYYFMNVLQYLFFTFIFVWYDELKLNGATWSVSIDIADTN